MDSSHFLSSLVLLLSPPVARLRVMFVVFSGSLFGVYVYWGLFVGVRGVLKVFLNLWGLWIIDLSRYCFAGSH